jgi:hypothetical protein
MLDVKIFNLVKELDFRLMSPLKARAYTWGSLSVYSDYVSNRFESYSSKYDLLHWLTFWTERERLGNPFQDEVLFKEIAAESSALHKKALSRLFSTGHAESGNHAAYDIWNGIDGYLVRQHCPDAKVVLDFGAGYGRLGAVWGAPDNGMTYIATDCIETSYVLQNLFLSSIADDNFIEYFDFAFERKNMLEDGLKENSIYHIPSWALGTLPKHSVDLISSVFVLPEISHYGLLDFVQQADHLVKLGGQIYLRDHLYQNDRAGHDGAHRFNTQALLENIGFEETYRGTYKDNVELYGTPRVLTRRSIK